MHVTLDVFSGRPNPGWRLEAAVARRLADRLLGAPAMPATKHPAGLGFRGFVVEREPDDPTLPPELPRRFRVAPRSSGGTLPNFEAPDCVDLLLHEAERAGQPEAAHAARHPAGAVGMGEEAMPAGAKLRWQAFVPTPALPEGGLAFTSPFRPFFWNRPAIQQNNNCYNYAANFASNTVAQPGRRGGQAYQAFTCGAVAQAAMADGVLPDLTTVARVIALAIWPGLDFHFWRLHSGGLWAHKLGLSTARSYDNAGRTIVGGLTPETCTRGPYTDFCGYFYVPVGTPVR